jgi:predicted nucleic acid-binding protein
LSFPLDMNAVSEIRRGRDQQVRAWAAAVDDTELHLSLMTLGEMRTGIYRLRNRDAAQADLFTRRLGELHTRFAGPILPVDARLADQWGPLNATVSRHTVDSLIAATAHVHDVTVVTRNTNDLEGCDVPLLNPWEHEPLEDRSWQPDTLRPAQFRAGVRPSRPCARLFRSRPANEPSADTPGVAHAHRPAQQRPLIGSRATPTRRGCRSRRQSDRSSARPECRR